jgi:DNA-binding CsgD family transcriptional regulator
VLELLTRWEVQDGRWSHAIAHGEEGIALANALGHADQLSIQLVKLASVNAARGEGELCRGRVDQACREADGHGLAVIRPPAGAAVGLLELSTGQAADAIPHLHRAVAEEERIGVHDRDHAPQPDLVEALVQTGRRDEASALLERYADVAARATPVWGGALVARCRGLLDDSFDEPFDQALALHSRVEDRFQEARTLLNYGERLRRAGRKVEARERLRAALAIFDELHGTPWAERASRELRATGERIRRAQPATGQELTPQELQVAMAVAEGVSNKAVAAALFISPKTVEFHLGGIYRKVGVSSRRELIRRFSTDRAAVVGSA